MIVPAVSSVLPVEKTNFSRHLIKQKRERKNLRKLNRQEQRSLILRLEESSIQRKQFKKDQATKERVEVFIKQKQLSYAKKCLQSWQRVFRQKKQVCKKMIEFYSTSITISFNLWKKVTVKLKLVEFKAWFRLNIFLRLCINKFRKRQDLKLRCAAQKIQKLLKCIQFVSFLRIRCKRRNENEMRLIKHIRQRRKQRLCVCFLTWKENLSSTNKLKQQKTRNEELTKLRFFVFFFTFYVFRNDGLLFQEKRLT